MKKLLESNIKYSKYEFTHGDSTRIVTYEKEENNGPDGIYPEGGLDFDLISDVDHENWLKWLNVEN